MVLLLKYLVFFVKTKAADNLKLSSGWETKAKHVFNDHVAVAIYTPFPQKVSKMFLVKTLKFVNKFPSDLDLRATDDRSQWRSTIHGAVKPRIEDDWSQVK